MIIKLKDLDTDVLSKLNQLDTVKQSYKIDPRKTVVSYNGKDFSLVKLPEIEKIEFSENDIAELQIALHNKRSNCRSSLLEDMRTDDKLHISTKSFYTEIPEFPVIQCKNTILKVFSINNVIFTYDADGMLTKFLNNEIVKSINIPNLLYSLFSIDIGVYTIKEFSLIDESTLLFITDRGVYRLNFTDEDIEFIIPEAHVRIAKQINENLILCGTDDYIVLYKSDSCKKISKFYNIHKSGQIPFKLAQYENKIFVLSKNVGLDILGTLLHVYEIDETGLNCVIRDEYVCPLLEAGNSDIKISNNTLYILHNGKILYQSIENLNSPFNILSDVSDVKSFDIVNDNLFALSNNSVFIYKSYDFYDKILLPGSPSKIFYNNDFYYLNNNKLSRFYLPVYQTGSDSLTYRIINDPCNNIDILIDGIGKDNIVTFYDGESLAVIKPSYYSIYNNKALIKITGCGAKKINMIIPVDDKLSLNGFVIRRNHLFLR